MSMTQQNNTQTRPRFEKKIEFLLPILIFVFAVFGS